MVEYFIPLPKWECVEVWVPHRDETNIALQDGWHRKLQRLTELRRPNIAAHDYFAWQCNSDVFALAKYRAVRPQEEQAEELRPAAQCLAVRVS